MTAKKPARFVKLSLTMAAVLVLGGCTRGTADLRDWVAKEKAKRGPPIPPLPVIKVFENFIYHDEGKRDPFSPSQEELRQNTGPRPDEHRPRQPLEAYALDSLKMVGTLSEGSAMEALVQDPSGMIHRVHINDYMGQNFGRVTAITSDRVELAEWVSNGNGGWIERPASIALEAREKRP